MVLARFLKMFVTHMPSEHAYTHPFQRFQPFLPLPQAISSVEAAMLGPGGAVESRLFALRTELALKLQGSEAKADKVEEWAARCGGAIC